MKLCNFNAGLDQPLFLIAGPCVIESESMTIDVAGKLKEMCDIIIRIPSNDTPRIQEAHILVGHIVCQLIEEEIFPNA